MRGRRSRNRAVKSCAAVLLFAGACRAQTAGRYRVEPEGSTIEIHVFRGGLFGALADNHTVVLTSFSGTAERREGGSWVVEVEGATGSLRVTDPRAAASTRDQVQRTMLGPTQLDAAHFHSCSRQMNSPRIIAVAPHTWWPRRSKYGYSTAMPSRVRNPVRMRDAS